MDPRPHFGRVLPAMQQRSSSDVFACWENEALHLRSDLPLDCDRTGASCEVNLRPGARHYFSLVFTNDAPSVYPSIGERAESIIELSINFWRSWSGQARYAGPYRDAVLRSALALKLLAFAPSGAIVASPTSSLPEWIGGERNWDYRYCWLRDASFTARALYNLGFEVEGDAYTHWLMYSTRLTHPGLQVLYSIYGESKLDESKLAHLSGYRNSPPVRLGNDAHRQFQLDIYGELLGAIEAFTSEDKDLGRATSTLVQELAGFVCRNWDKPDAGIWEQRAGEFHHVHGKVLAWVALDCAVRLAEQWKTKKKVPVDTWRRVRDEIRETTLRRGYNEKSGTFVATYEGTDLDGSLLTLPMVGFIKGDDPRMMRTIDAIRREISVDDLVYRYRYADGLPGDEGAFLTCSFWLVSALVHAKRVEEATELFEKLLSRANHVGLFSEEIDPKSGAFLGNFPQGLTHIALITAATTLQEAKA
jgi:GH15 family glucan-1,4-alpha-glucosidase